MPKEMHVELPADIYPLMDHEWTLIWMSVRYARGGSTIATATLPFDIIHYYYQRMNSSQKKLLVRDLSEYLEEFGKFGNEKIDDPIWRKFLAALDMSKHVDVKLVDGKTCRAFQCNERIYPLAEYIANPESEVYIPEESIVADLAGAGGRVDEN